MVTRHAALLAVALASVAAASAAASAGEANPPKILEVEYEEGTEYVGIGYRYSVSATIRRTADRVKARSGSVWAAGDLSDNVGTGGGKVWYFRYRKFVKSVRADFEDDGFAKVTVRARNDAGAVSKRCELKLEPSIYGHYAGSDCRRVGS